MSIKFAQRGTLALAAVLLSLTVNAQLRAQVVLCGAHGSLVDALKSKYKEDRQAIALSGTGSVIELYISQAGTWTMLVTSPKGQTCVMAAGHSWDGKTTVALGTAI